MSIKSVFWIPDPSFKITNHITQIDAHSITVENNFLKRKNIFPIIYLFYFLVTKRFMHLIFTIKILMLFLLLYICSFR